MIEFSKKALAPATECQPAKLKVGMTPERLADDAVVVSGRPNRYP